MRITGALINAVAILLGGGIGLMLKGKISEKSAQTVIRALGLCVCVIGIYRAIYGDVVLLIVSMALGAFTGELLKIDDGLRRFGLWMQSKFSKGDSKSSFAEGFVTATLLFCVGAMAVLGSIDSGLKNDQSIIISKSIIDAVSAMLFASSLGFGVLFSAIPVLLYQGGIELFAGGLQHILTESLIIQISAVGGVMLLGIGFNLVMEAKIRVANFLPGFLFAVLYYFLLLG